MIIYKNKICVYAHSISGVIFYIGKGRSGRPFNIDNRNGAWHEAVNSAGHFEVNILSWFDDDRAARQAERQQIRHYKPCANIYRYEPTKANAYQAVQRHSLVSKSESESPFAAFLINQMRQRRMKQARFAELLGITQGYLSRLLTVGGTNSSDIIWKISRCTKRPFEEIGNMAIGGIGGNGRRK
jgi:hypothetical protein